MANVYHVDVSVGSDDNDGLSHPGGAWASIGKALDTVVASDLVHVYGTADYATEHGSSGAIGKIITDASVTDRIKFIGNGGIIGDGGIATLNAGTNGLTNCLLSKSINGSSLYSFFNFRFTGASGSGVDMVNGGGYSRYNQWIQCQFDNNGGTGLLTSYGDDAAFCSFFNNVVYGTYLYVGSVSFSKMFNNGDSGVYLYGSCFCTQNIIFGNTACQIKTWNIGHHIINNTIDGKGISVGTGSSYNPIKVINNIIINCATGLSGRWNTDHMVSKSNCFYNNTTDKDGWPDDDSDINADPLFVDAANNDYRLLPYSPCRGTGIDVGEVIGNTCYMDVGARQANPSFSSAITDDS